MTNFKKAIIFGLVGWLVLAACSIIKYSGILNKTCYWQMSWLFCASSGSRLDISSFQKIVVYALIFLVFTIFIIYGRQCWRIISGDGEIKPNKKFSIFFVFIFIVLAVLIVPFGSGDMNYYYNSGQALALGQNVYTQDWVLKNELSYSSQASLMTGFSYGPITASLFKILYNLSHNINLFIIIWKLTVVLLFCLCAWLIFKLIKSYNLNLKEQDFFVLWLLQPLLLFEWVVNGHFDVMWICFVLLAMLFARQGRWFLVIPCLIAGVWIKYIPLLMVPWFILWWWQEIDKINWKKYLLQLAGGLLLGSLVTVFAWFPYWTGWSSFNSLAGHSKWVVSSWFGLIYYSLSPLFKWFLADKAHWYLTRLVHLFLFVVVIYFLYPYLKKVILVILKRTRWEDFDFYQAIFVSMFIFLFIWQKSFWPWYAAWLMPIGLLLYLKHKNIFLKRIIIWISLAPLLFYPVWIFTLQMWGVYAENQLWFYYIFVLAISAYPLFNLIKWRRSYYQTNFDNL